MNTSFDSSGSHQGIRYKTVMNILRRAFSFRRRERDSNREGLPKTLKWTLKRFRWEKQQLSKHLE